MIRPALVVTLLLCGLVPGCVAVDIPVAAGDPAADRQAVMDADRAFAEQTAEHGVDGWVSFFAEDGAMYLKEGVATGTDAIRAAMAAGFADPDRRLTWEPSSAVVSASGDLAYTLGRWELVSTETTGTAGVLGRGNYVTIWRREPGGGWKVVVDIGNDDPAPEDVAASD